MLDWKVILLVDHMESHEKIDFERWFKYELKDKETHPWHLFQLLKKGSAKFAEAKDLALALQKASGATPSKIRDYATRLAKKIELFLSIEQLKHDEYRKSLYLLEIAHKRNIDKYSQGIYEQLRNNIEKGSFLDPDDYRKLFELEELNYNYTQKEDSLQRTNELFDREWTLRKLEMACVNHSHKNIFGSNTNSFLLDQVIKELTQWDLWESCSLHKVYLELYLLFSQSEQSDLSRILDFMTKNLDSKERLSFKNAYIFLLNYQIEIYNTDGADQSGQELLNIYSWGANNRIIFRDQYLPWGHYKNLVTLPLKLGQKILAEKYLESYKEYLRPQELEEAYRYCQGVYNYKTGNYGQAKKLWGKEKFEKAFYEIHARIMSWEIEYERTKDKLTNPLASDELKSLLRKLTSFIQGVEGISGNHREILLNRLNLYKRLFSSKNQQELNTLATDASSIYPLNNQKWLLSMIEQLHEEFRDEGQLV